MIMAGRLTKSIQFSTVLRTKNEFNETVKKLIPIFRTRAEPFQSEISRTIVSEGGDFSKVYNFRLRYNRQIKDDLIITVDGQNLQITNIENVNGLNKELTIDAINYIQD